MARFEMKRKTDTLVHPTSYLARWARERKGVMLMEKSRRGSCYCEEGDCFTSFAMTKAITGGEGMKPWPGVDKGLSRAACSEAGSKEGLLKKELKLIGRKRLNEESKLDVLN